MRLLLVLTASLALGSTTSSAQNRGSADDALLEELRAVRIVLERVEVRQQGQLALAQIEIDENRIAALETQRRSLREREELLNAQVSTRSDALRKAEMGGAADTATGFPDRNASVGDFAAQLRDEFDQAARNLGAVRSELRMIETEIARRQARIRDTEQLLENFLDWGEAR